MPENPYQAPLEDCRVPPRPLPLGFWSYVTLALMVIAPFILAAVIFILEVTGILLRHGLR